MSNGDLNAAFEAMAQGQALATPGHVLGQPEVLFPKIMDRNDKSRLEIVERQKNKLSALMLLPEQTTTPPPQPEAQSQEPEAVGLAPDITYDDFAKLDLRTATIIAAEPVKGADKLLQLTVDLGFEQRTVVSGIALHFSPEAVVGQRVVLVANLAPRKLRGVMSQGMILMAEDASGKLSFVSAPEGAGNGMIVK